MKPFKIISVVILFSGLVSCSCKKTGNEPRDFYPIESMYFTFDYNGQTYDRKEVDSAMDCYLNFNSDTRQATGFVIDKPDVFGGTITFDKNSGGYFFPADSSSDNYFYQSGSFTATNHDCTVKNYIGGETGLHYSYTYCYVKGSFTLIFTNNRGDSMKVTNGSFNLMYIYYTEDGYGF